MCDFSWGVGGSAPLIVKIFKDKTAKNNNFIGLPSKWRKVDISTRPQGFSYPVLTVITGNQHL